jgi:gliding motility-associated-like protein
VSTTYSVLVENKILGCSIEMSFIVTVFNFDPLQVMITASTDSIIIGDDVQLTVNQDPTWTYEWSSNPPDDIENVYNPVVSPPTEGDYTYTVTVTNDGGCTAVASIGVSSYDPPCDDSDIFIPNAFSPNGDGENDVLFVRGNFILDVELHIYNRWGQEVFSTTDQSIGWDGTFEGAELTPDVFGYYLNIGCPGEKSFAKQGNITLLR